MTISTVLGTFYTGLSDFAGITGDATDYTPVTSAAIQWGGSNFLTFDVITEREHSGDTSVTEHPVEDGPDITDHVRPAPYEITLEAFISNTPITGGTLVSTPLDVATYTAPFSPTPGAAFAAIGQGVTALQNAIFGAPDPPNAKILTFASPFDAVADTLAQLQSFHDNSTLLTLITSECSYDQCVMTSFKLGKTHETGSGATCSMAFKVLNIVQTSVTTAPAPAVVRGAVALNAGQKAPTPAPQKDSLLTTVSQWISN